MLAPSTTGGLRPSKRVREQVTGTEMSATASRSVRKTVLRPGRRLTWATCPSTHTAPSRSTQPAIAFAICRTGAGDSSEVSMAMRARLDDPTDAGDGGFEAQAPGRLRTSTTETVVEVRALAHFWESLEPPCGATNGDPPRLAR